MNYEELKQYFELHCKPSAAAKEGQKLGVEYETLVLVPSKKGSSKQGYHPLPITGESGIPGVLERFQAVGKLDGVNWERKFEGENLVGLFTQDGSSITIEPGGQLELSDAPRESLVEVETSIRRFVRHLNESLNACGGRLLFMGVHPLFELDSIPLLPKKRYRIMFPHMSRVGSHGQWMMKSTAGTQLSLDYASMDDLERKFRVICRLSPFLTAIFANSPIHLGKPSGFKSFRNYIWQNTDETRCGIPPPFISPQFRIEDYIDWSLKASPYHLNREGKIYKLTGYSFTELMRNAHPRIRVGFEDWKDHIGMLFPEVRIKNIIEVRSMDTLSPDDVLAVHSLLKSLIYDESVFGRLETLLMNLPEEEFPWYQQVAARDGLEGRVNGVNFRDIGINLLELALESLTPVEACRLSVFFDRYTRHGLSPADLVLERYYSAGEDPQKWIQVELEATREKESTFLNFPCQFPENPVNFRAN